MRIVNCFVVEIGKERRDKKIPLWQIEKDCSSKRRRLFYEKRKSKAVHLLLH
jgi:hypothetical protein